MFTLIMERTSLYAIPLIILFIVSYAYFVKKVKVYEVFCEGAKEGFSTAIRIIPFLVAMLVVIGVFRSSGVIDVIIKYLNPILEFIGMPGEVLPMAIMRPLSGGGSTETTFYVLAVYFGAVSIRKTRHAVAAGLLADIARILAAVWICNLMFS